MKQANVVLVGIVACAMLPAVAAAKVSCSEIATKYKAHDVVITSTTAVPEVTEGTTAAPAHCDVRGTIRGNIKFALFLPVEWNGRFQMVGNGGKAGSILVNDMRPQLRLGYATVNTDTGHDASIPSQAGSKFGEDAVYGKELEIDFAWRAVHLTAVAAKDLVKAHYGRKNFYSYWSGCSTGGRQGLMEAQRFPDDFDGYVVGAPVGTDYTEQEMAATGYLQPLYTRIPPRPGMQQTDGPFLSTAKRDMVGAAVYARCDALDGVVDGQLRNPTKCDFDPARHIPICSQTSGDACLTPNELAIFQAIYAGKPPHVPGMLVGSENIPGGWSSFILPNSITGTPGLHTSSGGEAFEYLMFTPDRPGWNYLTEFDWSVTPREMEQARRLYSPNSPDLRGVLDRKSKIILYHGFNDPAVNALRSIRYRDSVIDFMDSRYGRDGHGHGGKDRDRDDHDDHGWGDRDDRHHGHDRRGNDRHDDDDGHRGHSHVSKGESVTDSFFKLYFVPGMAHCSGGTGHSTVDWLSSVVNWVERGVEPKAIIGSKAVASGTSTRPHCPYPQEAVYKGGDPEKATSYTCRKSD